MLLTQGTNLPRIKQSNQQAIHRMLYQYGPTTRSEIAGRLSLTMPTVTTNINTMMNEGIVQEVGVISSDTPALGRKVRLVDIVPESRYFIGVEMRGTMRCLCIVNYRGKTVMSLMDDEFCDQYDECVRRTAKLILQAVEANAVEREKIFGIGVCVPGIVDVEEGVLRKHPGYNWVDKKIVADIRRLTGYEGPLTVDNNAIARAYSAQLFHRELLNEVQSFAYMFISQGIACPLIYNYQLDFGYAVGSGEVGHMVMDQWGPTCVCGNRGCLEAYASDLTICKRCEEAVRMGEAPILRALCGERRPTIEEVIKAQQMGETGVDGIIATAVRTLGVALANLINFARPHTFLIEGMLFLNEQNRVMLHCSIDRNLYSATNSKADLVFVTPDKFSGAKAGAAIAIRFNLG